MSAQTFTALLAMVGLVIVVATLLSGVIEKTGLALLDPAVDSPILQIVATLSLTLVLFTDAIGLDTAELRRHAILAVRVLGPGTLLSAALVGLLAWGLLGLAPAPAAILGAALASTDPVLLRGIT